MYAGKGTRSLESTVCQSEKATGSWYISAGRVTTCRLRTYLIRIINRPPDINKRPPCLPKLLRKLWGLHIILQYLDGTIFGLIDVHESCRNYNVENRHVVRERRVCLDFLHRFIPVAVPDEMGKEPGATTTITVPMSALPSSGLVCDQAEAYSVLVNTYVSFKNFSISGYASFLSVSLSLKFLQAVGSSANWKPLVSRSKSSSLPLISSTWAGCTSNLRRKAEAV